MGDNFFYKLSRAAAAEIEASNLNLGLSLGGIYNKKLKGKSSSMVKGKKRRRRRIMKVKAELPEPKRNGWIIEEAKLEPSKFTITWMAVASAENSPALNRALARIKAGGPYSFREARRTIKPFDLNVTLACDGNTNNKLQGTESSDSSVASSTITTINKDFTAQPSRLTTSSLRLLEDSKEQIRAKKTRKLNIEATHDNDSLENDQKNRPSLSKMGLWRVGSTDPDNRALNRALASMKAANGCILRKGLHLVDLNVAHEGY